LAAIANQGSECGFYVRMDKLQRFPCSVLEVDQPISARQIQEAKPQFLQGFKKWPRGPCIIGHGIALGDQSVA
jgi:hypothetical protein